MVRQLSAAWREMNAWLCSCDFEVHGVFKEKEIGGKNATENKHAELTRKRFLTDCDNEGLESYQQSFYQSYLIYIMQTLRFSKKLSI